MTWLLVLPGHQQPWYRLWRMYVSLSSTRKDFDYLCHLTVGKWCKYIWNMYIKYRYIFMFRKINSALQGFTLDLMYCFKEVLKFIFILYDYWHRDDIGSWNLYWWELVSCLWHMVSIVRLLTICHNMLWHIAADDQATAVRVSTAMALTYFSHCIQPIVPSLVQIMACRLFGTKP